MKGRIFSIVALMVLAGSLQAIPLTCLGGVNTPSAYVLPHLMAEFSAVSYFGPGVDKLDLDNNDVALEEQDLQFTYGAGVNFGLYDRGEIGLVYTGNEMFLVNLKLQVLLESETMPAISVGVENLFSDFSSDDRDDPDHLAEFDYVNPEMYEANSMYAVMSKSTVLRGLPFTNYLETVLHLGIGSNRFKGNSDVAKQFGGLFGAVEIHPMPFLSFSGEMDGSNLNVGADFMYRNLEVRACLFSIEEIGREGYGRDKPRFALNLRYTMDYFSEIKAAGKYSQYSPVTDIRPDQRGRETIRREGGAAAADNPLLEELEAIRAKRRQAEKELEEIKKVLEE